MPWLLFPPQTCMESAALPWLNFVPELLHFDLLQLIPWLVPRRAFAPYLLLPPLLVCTFHLSTSTCIVSASLRLASSSTVLPAVSL